MCKQNIYKNQNTVYIFYLFKHSTFKAFYSSIHCKLNSWQPKSELVFLSSILVLHCILKIYLGFENMKDVQSKWGETPLIKNRLGCLKNTKKTSFVLWLQSHKKHTENILTSFPVLNREL